MQVLIVEDSLVTRRLLVGSLSRWGYEVTEADDGAAAWQILERQHFPLVLTDWIMPRMDGIELTSRIRGGNWPSYVYIILLTAQSETDNLVTAMDAGADDFLAKPFHQDELRVRVREGERMVRLQRALADQNRRLRETQAALVQSEKLASLGQLAAGMAHEINNPIAYVTNHLAVLKRDTLQVMAILETYRRGRESLTEVNPAWAQEVAQLEEACDLGWIQQHMPRLFDMALEGLSRVRAVVKNLREFARLDEAEFDERDLNAAVQSTLEVLKHQLDQKQLTVETQLQPLPPIRCRPAGIHQVLYNILLNAIQASPSGGSIQVQTLADPSAVEVLVADHGCGIAAEDLPRIFEPFFTTKPVGQGQGLGLAISYGIVRDHAGSILVESQVDQGSVFRIRLPRQPAPVGGEPGHPLACAPHREGNHVQPNQTPHSAG